jgi:hypothetical protein
VIQKSHTLLGGEMNASGEEHAGNRDRLQRVISVVVHEQSNQSAITMRGYLRTYDVEQVQETSLVQMEFPHVEARSCQGATPAKRCSQSISWSQGPSSILGYSQIWDVSLTMVSTQ